MKKAVRTVTRPRWLLGALAVAALVVPALTISGGASAGKTGHGGPTNPAHPVVDANWIYENNFYGGTHFIYKMAGADGCSIQATTCDTSGGGTQNDINNLPQNYNGAQEFNQWWGVTGSNHDHNGPLGRFQTVRHHLFPVKSWSLDDLQITIPGANCAGEQIHTAFHSDATQISNINPSTSLTPLSGMHSGSYANGDVYDANMGGIMNWEEVGSVLRWHSVNGTYPSKTISETNYDAELAGLVGSGDYSATGGGHTSLLAPASVGDTNIKVASVSALNAAGTTGIFGVGQPVAIDEVTTENGTVASIGTAAQSTTLTARSAVGDTNVKVASVTGVTVGHSYRVGVPPNDEYPTVSAVGTASSTATTLAGPAAAGDTNIKVGSISGFTVGQGVRVDATPNDEYGTVASVGTAAASATTLAAAANAGDTNVKVTSITGMTVGHLIKVDTGANLEVRTITSVGTAGSGGTGIDLSSGLTNSHASGAGARDLGTGVTLSAPLAAAHADGSAAQALGTGVTFTAPLTKAHAQGEAAGDLGTGVTLSAPLTKAHAVGTTVNGPTTGLISDSPQGQIVMVLNNDQDGLDYPAPKWGTDHYMNDLVNGGVGPWFNNINATPIANTGTIYSSDGFARLQHNLPNVVAFRNSVANAVQQAFSDLGQKYNFSIPLENPLLLKNTGSVPDNPAVQFRPAYSPGDQAQYSPVLDDRTGRTDQVSFGNRGIPSLGDIGQYDSNTTPLIGGNENPYPAGYPSKPTLSGMFGQDSNSDYFSNLNYWASGTVHGPGGYDKPSEGLLRGVETIATWFSYVIASPAGGGATPMPNHPIAYFDMTPRKATATRTVTFDAGYSRDKGGMTDGLTYYWDFGDGTPLVKTTDTLIQHTFPQQAGWYDVKLLVGKGGKWGSFRQVEPINFFPTYYPAVPPASEPLPPSTGPAADPCGTLSTDEQNTMITAAKAATDAPPSSQTQDDLASYALKAHG